MAFRFSGHESFACRYAWLPKALSAVRINPRIFADEEDAMVELHRVNEIVLRRYYDIVTGGKPRPDSRSIGAYISALRNHKAGDKKVIAGLESIKDLHRNPLIHPEETLETVDEAIALHGAIQSVMVHMLKVVPAGATLPATPQATTTP